MSAERLCEAMESGQSAFPREWLDLGVVRRLWWCDTDDMLADGMTKGAVDRDAILKLCNNGLWDVLKKPVKFSAAEAMIRTTTSATGC